MGMTRQYLAGELSVLLGHLQAATTTEASGRDAWSLRQAAETEPVTALGSVTIRALALTERLCRDSLNRGDMLVHGRSRRRGWTRSAETRHRTPLSYPTIWVSEPVLVWYTKSPE
jgi:hypothetical protein